MKAVDIACPGCGAPASLTDSSCSYCGRPVVITSFSTLHEFTPGEVAKYMRTYEAVVGDGAGNPGVHSALGMCFLKLGLYDKARAELSVAMSMQIDNSETFFYAAVAELGGRKPFLCARSNVENAEAYALAATRLEPRGVYFVLLAYLQKDFYERKYLRPAISSDEYAGLAQSYGVSVADEILLGEVLGTSDLVLDFGITSNA